MVIREFHMDQMDPHSAPRHYLLLGFAKFLIKRIYETFMVHNCLVAAKSWPGRTVGSEYLANAASLDT